MILPPTYAEAAGTLPAMRRRTLFAFALIAMVAAVPGVVTDVVDTSFYIIDEDSPGDEDAYVLADSGSIESILDGDLTIGVYGDLTISGVVTGDVNVASGGAVIVTETGSVEGSIRGAARRVEVAGAVGDDVAVVAVRTAVTGSVGRDLIGAGGSFDVTGSIGRNLQGWFFSGTLDGTVGNDVDVRVGSLRIGSDTDVGGDLLYRADSDAEVAEGAEVAGSFARLSTRAPFVVRVALTVFTLFGFIAFALIGLLVLWASRRAAPRAAGAVVTRPWRVAGVGLLVVAGLPALTGLVVWAVPAFLTKLFVVVLFALVAAIGALFGPIPALAAAGDRLSRGRAGLLGGFVIGVVVWRLLVWLLPVVGFLVSLVVLVFGIGAWLTTWWDRRAARPRLPLPEPAKQPEDTEAGWEPPLPPDPSNGDDVSPDETQEAH